MIKKRLLGLVPDSKKYILENVIFQWIGMCSNVVMVYTIAYLLDDILKKEQVNYISSALIIIITLIMRVLCVKLAHRASYNASRSVKKNLRGLLYEKILRLGASYTEQVSTAEVVQLAGEE